MLKTILLTVLLSIVGCIKDDNNGNENKTGTKVFFVNNIDSHVPEYVFNFDSVKFEGDSLKIGYSYSGGCETHGFFLYIESKPMNSEFSATFNHHSNGDLCEAYISDVLSYDITELKSLNQNNNFLFLKFKGISSIHNNPDSLYRYDYKDQY
jgi:hypothetical protein